jgi:hypothetical protein
LGLAKDSARARLGNPVKNGTEAALIPRCFKNSRLVDSFMMIN